MKKLLLSIFVASSFAANAQVTVFEDSFETYNDFSITGFGDWLTLDLDQLNTYVGGSDVTGWSANWDNAGDPQAWMIFNPSNAYGELNGAPVLVSNNMTGTPEFRNFDPHTGSKYAAAWAGVPSSNGQTATSNNDFLISPVLNLGASNNVLTFWVKAMSSSYGPENYRVYVYQGTGTPTTLAEFGAPISGIAAVAAPFPNWEQKTYSLDAYANSAIRVGIRYVSADAYMLMVDDFKVTSSNLAVNDALSAKFSVYPNPSNGIISLTNADAVQVKNIQITDLNGRTVKTLNYTDAPANIQINISDLSSGMYLMNISSNEGTAVKKIMKN